MGFGGSGGSGSGSLASSSDVALNLPANSEVLTYNGTIGKWQNQTLSGGASDATTSSKGIVQLAGDLGGSAASPTVPGLSTKLNTSQRGAANGVASLDGTTHVPVAQIPDLSASYLSASSLTTALRSVDACIFYDSGTSSYPLRSSVTTDTLRRVRWIGPVAPTAGGGYAAAGLDVWEVTA